MAQAYPQTEAEWRQRHNHVIAAYARGMRAERKGGFDQMGWRARIMVGTELDVIPALQRTRAALWEHRTFVLGCLALIVAAANVAVRW